MEKSFLWRNGGGFIFPVARFMAAWQILGITDKLGHLLKQNIKMLGGSFL